MVSAFLSEGPQFRPEFKYGVEFKKTATSEEVKENQTVVKFAAAAFNHRDIWILTGNYAGIVLNSVLGSDGVGHIIKNGKIDQRVLVNPAIGWISDPRKPEKTPHIFGLLPAIGTLTEEPVVVDQEDVVPCPEHLSLAEAAALPLAGLTAYRYIYIYIYSSLKKWCNLSSIPTWSHIIFHKLNCFSQVIKTRIYNLLCIY